MFELYLADIETLLDRFYISTRVSLNILMRPIMGESDFIKEYQNSSQLRANFISKGSTLLSVQSYFIELFLMIIVSCMLLLINYNNLDITTYLTTIVIFIASLIKLLPNINIISSSISSIKSLYCLVEVKTVTSL